MPDFTPNLQSRILIVEDDELLREALCSLLEQEGYEVHTAANGNEALEKIASEPYNAVILDLVFRSKYRYIHEIKPSGFIRAHKPVSIKLPLTVPSNVPVFRKKHLQGVEVLRRLHSESPTLPIVVISGNASDETLVESVLTGGAYNFLLKPFEPVDILKSIANAVQKEKIDLYLLGVQGEDDGSLLIEGISNDMHVFVKQYGYYFEQYLWHFKGIPATPAFFPEFHALRVAFQTEHPLGEIKEWFREYMAFAEQFNSVNPIVSAPRTAEQVALYSEQLNLQIKHFASSVDSAYWRNPVGMAAKSERQNALCLNPMKIVNSFQLKTRNSGLTLRQVEASEMIRQAIELITNDNTLQALQIIIEFCKKHGDAFARIVKEVFMLKYRITRALNDKRHNLSAAEACNLELNNAHNVLIFDIIPQIEKIALDSVPQNLAA
ncbi:MAG: response regulator [Phycisphaerae bacterium]|nr:response regulator [Saprospiraceae bacterium]